MNLLKIRAMKQPLSEQYDGGVDICLLMKINILFQV